MKPFEVKKLKNYFNSKFESNFYSLKLDNSNNSAEVYFKDEFIGLIYKDEEDGEVAYQFHMTVLNEDLLNG